jgi:hypothetical protein
LSQFTCPQCIPAIDLLRAQATIRSMGFNRRKLEDERRRAAEKEAASRRATGAQILGDAERLIAAWNERQAPSVSLIVPLAVGLALSGCTTGQTPLASSEAPLSSGDSIGQRDLTPEEKKVIMDAVGPSLRNPGSAKFYWAKFPAVVTEGSVNYCATVDGQSPYAAYNGRQAYIVQAQMSGNRVSSAVIGLVAGGKDFAVVTNMCAKYGLDPRNAS